MRTADSFTAKFRCSVLRFCCSVQFMCFTLQKCLLSWLLQPEYIQFKTKTPTCQSKTTQGTSTQDINRAKSNCNYPTTRHTCNQIENVYFPFKWYYYIVKRKIPKLIQQDNNDSILYVTCMDDVKVLTQIVTHHR